VHQGGASIPQLSQGRQPAQAQLGTTKSHHGHVHALAQSLIVALVERANHARLAAIVIENEDLGGLFPGSQLSHNPTMAASTKDQQSSSHQ
jgi:hypothetical protein